MWQINLTQIEVNCTAMRIDRSLVHTRVPASLCMHVKGLVASFHYLKLDALLYMQTQLDHIYDMLEEIPTESSGRLNKRSWWSKGWSFVTGLAEKDEVDSVKKVLDKVEKGIDYAANVWKTGTSEFIAAMKVEKTRVDNLCTLLRLQRSTFRKFNEELIEIYHETDTRMSILGHMMNTLKSTIFQISEMDHVYNALQFMLTGRLPHFLITHKTLLSSLDRLEQFLSSEHPELTSVQRNVKYYYETAEFKTFRYGQHLVVILVVPLTTRQLLNPLSIYELKLLPLASPVKTDKHYTMLNVNFYAVAYSVDSEYYLVIDYHNYHPLT